MTNPLSFSPQKATEKIVDFIAKSFRSAGFSLAVIAASGGVDSSTSLALTVRALEVGNVFPVLLPYGDMYAQGVTDAKSVAQSLGVPDKNIEIVDVKPMVDAAVAPDPSMDNVRRGNIMARTRMTVLFDRAKKHKALVVGTENRTEHLLGYFTRFGDEASDVEPLRNLYKTQVYRLARFLKIPKKILEKKPTAGLWEGQTDEGEFGFTYKDADEVLSLLYDEKLSVDDIVNRGLSREIVDKVVAHAQNNSFKHHLPLVPDRD
jgi:NAD+ synthase